MRKKKLKQQTTMDKNTANKEKSRTNFTSINLYSSAYILYCLF